MDKRRSANVERQGVAESATRVCVGIRDRRVSASPTRSSQNGDPNTDRVCYPRPGERLDEHAHPGGLLCIGLNACIYADTKNGRSRRVAQIREPRSWRCSGLEGLRIDSVRFWRSAHVSASHRLAIGLIGGSACSPQRLRPHNLSDPIRVFRPLCPQGVGKRTFRSHC